MSEQADKATAPAEQRRWLTDAQAGALFAAYIIFRMVANRVGFAYLPRLLEDAPWAIPFLNNSTLVMVAAGTGVRGETTTMMATAATSVVQSFIAGGILYWAGYRFGPWLAERAAQTGSMWASVWNPKQVARASRWVDRRGVYAIFIARGAVEWMLTPVVLVAGSTKMRLHKFLASFGAGAVVYAALMLWLGGRAGDAWPWLPDRIKAFGDWSLRIAIILVVLALLAMALSRREQKTQSQDSETTTPSQGSSDSPSPTD